MPVESAADRLAFLDTDEHGVTATWGAASVPGIFDNEFTAIDGLGLPVAVDSAMPRFTCRTADVDGITGGDPVTINGTGYTVRSVQPDGTGMTVLVLSE